MAVNVRHHHGTHFGLSRGTVATAAVLAIASFIFASRDFDNNAEALSTASLPAQSPQPHPPVTKASPQSVYARETTGLGMIDSATTDLLVKLNNGEPGLVYGDPTSIDGKIIQVLLNSLRDITKHKTLPINGAGTHSTFDAFKEYAYPRMGRIIRDYPGAEIGKVAVTRMVLDSLVKNETDPVRLQLAHDLNHLLDMTIDGKSTFAKQGFTAGTKAAAEYGNHLGALWRVLNAFDFVPENIDTNSVPVPIWGPGTTKRLENVKTALALEPDGTYINREFVLRATAALIGHPNYVVHFQKPDSTQVADAVLLEKP